jgi:hypothetical protein
MIKSFVEHLNVLKSKQEYVLIQDLKKVKVNFHISLDTSVFTIDLNADTQIMSLRKDNYLIDEIKVYNDTTSGEQSLNVALTKMFDTIDELNKR